jgi:hypothetical protein
VFLVFEFKIKALSLSLQLYSGITCGLRRHLVALDPFVSGPWLFWQHKAQTAIHFRFVLRGRIIFPNLNVTLEYCQFEVRPVYIASAILTD